MCQTKYRITLEDHERRLLLDLNKNPLRSKITRKRAMLLLALDHSTPAGAISDAQAAELTALTPRSILRLRKLFVEEGFEIALHGYPRSHPRRTPKIDGAMEARLVQMACSKPPGGYSNWSLRLLTSRFVELAYPEGICVETVRQTLKKTSSSPGERSIL
jgi:hypothetical protein